jgi:hypothetical protein
MSEDMKNENEVFASVRAIILQGLQYFNVEGFDVRRFAQANFNHGDGLVLMNLVDTERAGWQSCKYVLKDLGFEREDRWIEIQTYQISTIKRMRPEDTVETITAEDVATRLISWFNGVGMEELRKVGLSSFMIDPNSIIVYNDDSDLYQRRPVFEVKIIVNKKFSVGQPDVDILGVRTKPI